MLNDVYNRRILELAGTIPRIGRLDQPDASATAHSKLCGSTVSVDLKMDGDTVTDFAHEVKACALGQASSSIMARNVVGAKADELRALREAVRRMLKENGAPPAEGKWADIAVLEPVRDYKARHASTMLTFDAVVDAINQIEAKRGATQEKWDRFSASVEICDAPNEPRQLFDQSRRAPRLAGRGLIKAYRYTLSPLVGFHCRHLPTCSEYADEALDRYGLWAGGWMTLARLCAASPGARRASTACPRPRRRARIGTRHGVTGAGRGGSEVRMIRKLTHRDSLRESEQLLQPPRRLARSEPRRLRVPGARLRRRRPRPRAHRACEHAGIVGRAERQRGARVARLRGAGEQQPRRRDIALHDQLLGCAGRVPRSRRCRAPATQSRFAQLAPGTAGSATAATCTGGATCPARTGATSAGARKAIRQRDRLLARRLGERPGRCRAAEARPERGKRGLAFRLHGALQRQGADHQQRRERRQGDRTGDAREQQAGRRAAGALGQYLGVGARRRGGAANELRMDTGTPARLPGV